MDEVLAIAIQEVALEGPEGCSVPSLWELLQEPLQAAGFALDPPLQDFIWQQLLQTPGIHFVSTNPLESSKTGEASSDKSQAPEDIHPPRASKQAPPLRVSLPKAHAELQSWQKAAGVGIHVQAAKALRDSALGLYESVVSGSQLSEIQYDSLVKIGRARSRGALQNTLARSFGIANTNYHYQVRQLETRGLIIRRHVILPGSVGVSPLNTNLLHLMRFGQSVDLSSRTHFRTAPKGAQKLLTHLGGENTADLTGGTDDKASAEDCDFIDLTQQMEEICEVLGAARGGVLVDGELRTSLAYTNIKEWKSLLKRLEGEGLVRLFRAEVNGRVKACIQLTSEAPEPQAESEALEDESPDGVILDVPVDRQIFDCIGEAGAEGVLSKLLWEKLRLNPRSNSSWLSALIESGHVTQQAETLKKVVLYRLWTAKNNPGGVQKKGQQPPREVRTEEEGTRANSDEKPRGQALEKGPVEDATPDQQLVVYEENNAIVPAQGPPKTSFVSRFKRTTKVMTGDAVRRKELILEKLKKDGYVLRSTLGRWIGTATGRDNPADTKLINRTLTDLHNEKQIKALSVTVPFQSDDSKSRQVEVIVLKNFEPHASFAEFIAKRVRSDARISRQEGMRAQQERAKKETVLKGAEVTRLGRKESRQRAEAMLDTQNAMKHNGYLYSKVLRARALYLYTWQHVIGSQEKLAEASGDAKEVEQDENTNQRVGQEENKKERVEQDENTNQRVEKDENTKQSETASKVSRPNAEGILKSIREAVDQAEARTTHDDGNTSAERNSPDNGGSIHEHQGEKADVWFDVIQLVREMPVQLYVQIVGSELSLERISELIQKGARVKDCTSEELESEVLGPQALSRLSITVDLMQRMELIAPNSRLAAGDEKETPSSNRKNLSAAYKLTETLRLESPADNAPVLHTFAASKEVDVVRYWELLEATFGGLKKEDACKLFPGTVASEINGRVWAMRHELSPTQRIELEKLLSEDKELGASELEAVAKQTGVASDQVYKVYYERTRKARLRKLLSLGLTQSEVMTALRKRKAADDTKEKPSGHPTKAAKREPIEAELVESARARARKTLTTEPMHVRAFKRKQAEATQEGPEALEPPAYKIRRIPESGGSAYVSWARDNVRMPEDDVITGQHDASFVDPRQQVQAKRWKEDGTKGERLGAGGKLVAPRRARKKRARAGALLRPEGESGEDDVAALPGEPRALRDKRKESKPFARRSKRFSWTRESTKKLIAAYAKWHAIHGKRRPTEWGSVPDLPAPVQNCRRHMTKLRRDKATLEAIAYAVVLACQRRADALKSSQGVEIQSETGPSEDIVVPSEDIVVRELSLMLKDEREKEDAKQKGKGSSAEHEAMERIATQEAPRGSPWFAWDDERDPIFARALEAVPIAYEEAKGQHVPATEAPVEKSNESEENLEGPHLCKGDHVQEVEERLGDNPGVATAFNLVQIGLLHARPNGAISDTIARTLKGCGEDHVAQAMRYLQAHKFVVRSKPTHPFRMAERFQQRLSSSPFPSGIGKSAREYRSSLSADAANVGSSGMWAPVPTIPSEGQLAALLALAAEGSAILEPFEASSAPWGQNCQQKGPPETVLQERGAPEWELGVQVRGPDAIEALSHGLRAENVSAQATDLQRKETLQEQATLETETPAAEASGRAKAHSHAESADRSLLEEMRFETSPPSMQGSEEANKGGKRMGSDGRSLKKKQRLAVEAGQASQRETEKGPSSQMVLAEPAKAGDNVALQSMTEADVSIAFDLCCEAWCQNEGSKGPPLEKHDVSEGPPFDKHDISKGPPLEKHDVSKGPPLERGLLRSVLEKVRAAGEDGVTLDNVSKVLETQSCSSKDGVAAEAEQYVEALEAFDLVKRVNSVECVRVMAAPAAERYLLPVQYNSPTNQELQRGTPAAKPGLRIQPWLTPRGGINRAYCALLKRRVISLVMVNPGIPEDLLVCQLEVLTPQSCRDFLASLVTDGHLSVRTAAEVSEPGRSEIQTRKRVVKHYFASAAAIFSL